jgi:hypothetical protein
VLTHKAAAAPAAAPAAAANGAASPLVTRGGVGACRHRAGTGMLPTGLAMRTWARATKATAPEASAATEDGTPAAERAMPAGSHNLIATPRLAALGGGLAAGATCLLPAALAALFSSALGAKATAAATAVDTATAAATGAAAPVAPAATWRGSLVPRRHCSVARLGLDGGGGAERRLCRLRSALAAASELCNRTVTVTAPASTATVKPPAAAVKAAAAPARIGIAVGLRCLANALRAIRRRGRGRLFAVASIGVGRARGGVAAAASAAPPASARPASTPRPLRLRLAARLAADLRPLPAAGDRLISRSSRRRGLLAGSLDSRQHRLRVHHAACPLLIVRRRPAAPSPASP